MTIERSLRMMAGGFVAASGLLGIYEEAMTSKTLSRSLMGGVATPNPCANWSNTSGQSPPAGARPSRHSLPIVNGTLLKRTPVASNTAFATAASIGLHIVSPAP